MCASGSTGFEEGINPNFSTCSLEGNDFYSHVTYKKCLKGRFKSRKNFGGVAYFKQFPSLGTCFSRMLSGVGMVFDLQNTELHSILKIWAF